MQVKIPVFEGPLDLLLHLIDKAEVDIYDISVSEITEQYMHYIHQMQKLELEIASEFLVMAAKLLAMKSRLLLPPKEEEHEALAEDYEELDPREELINRLIEYKKFKDAAEHLRVQEVQRSQIFTRAAFPIEVETEVEGNPVANISLFDLMDALEDILSEKTKDHTLRRIEREEVSIEKRITEIRFILKRFRSLPFSALFQEDATKDQVIVTFLALLELMKKKEVFCKQPKLFAEIMIEENPEASLYEN